MPDETKIQYLGDGVYADYSAGELVLKANDHLNPTDTITIEGATLVNLFKFVEKHLNVKINIKPKEEKSHA
jgi:hypothetical protein